MSNNTSQTPSRYRLEDENGVVQARTTTEELARVSYKYVVNKLGERCYVYDELDRVWVHNTFVS